MAWLPLVLALLASSRALPLPSTSSSTVLLPPLFGSPDEALLLLAGHGAEGVQTNDYVATATAIQTAAEVRLWIAVVEYQQSMSATEYSAQVDAAIASAAAAGFQGNASSIFFAAHGNPAGTLSAAEVLARGAAGLVLLGGFLPRPAFDLELYPAPVFTLAGELDGITRVTRIAREYTVYDNAALENPERALLEKAVAVLSGVNHALFAGAFALSGDLAAETSDSAARSAVGQAVGAFVTAHVSSNGSAVDRSLSVLQSLAEAAAPFVVGFNEASTSAYAESWCKMSNELVHNLRPEDQSDVAFRVEYFSDFDLFVESKPALSNSTSPIDVYLTTHNVAVPNPDDSASLSAAPAETRCKGFGQAWVTMALGGATPAGPEGTAGLSNVRAVELALEMVPTASRERYLLKGKQLSMDTTDVVVDQGNLWVEAPLIFEPSPSDPNVYIVQSVALVVPPNSPVRNLRGMRYGTMLSTAQAIEWILIDSLRD